MRFHAALALAFLTVCTAVSGDTEITRDEVITLRSYTLDELVAKSEELEGQIVRLKFNYRSSLFEKGDDGSIKGMLMIWRYRPTTSRNIYTSGSCQVTVPPEGAEWFFKLPTSESRGSLLVIARVGKTKTGIGQAKLLGREIKTETKGSRIVW